MEDRERQYLALNGKYLNEARLFLAEKDYVQASEKLWGACAEIVKAVAAKRGVELGTHASLWAFVSQLNKEKPEWNLLDEFSYAGNLHVNFYEGWLTADYVERGLEIAEAFIGKMRSLV